MSQFFVNKRISVMREYLYEKWISIYSPEAEKDSLEFMTFLVEPWAIYHRPSADGKWIFTIFPEFRRH